jgi:hypothetical protein
MLANQQRMVTVLLVVFIFSFAQNPLPPPPLFLITPIAPHFSSPSPLLIIGHLPYLACFTLKPLARAKFSACSAPFIPETHTLQAHATTILSIPFLCPGNPASWEFLYRLEPF